MFGKLNKIYKDHEEAILVGACFMIGIAAYAKWRDGFVVVSSDLRGDPGEKALWVLNLRNGQNRVMDYTPGPAPK